MQQYPPEQPSQYPYPQLQPFQPVQPPPPTKPKPPKWAMGCGYAVIALVVLGLCGGIYSLTLGRSSANSPTPTVAISQSTSAPTQASKPTSVPQAAYPPKTKADLMALAAKGDASVVHEFHSESVGLTGVCPQPKRLVTVSSKITGKKLAEDLLAYFFANGLDNPCGSVVFAFHTQAEGNGDNGYTAGRVLLDVTDASGNANTDPNATGLKYTITLDTGDVATGQEYTVSYTS